MSNVAFLDETELCERSLRRRAAAAGVYVQRVDDQWLVNGVWLTSDEAWDLLTSN